MKKIGLGIVILLFGDPICNPMEWNVKKLGDLSLQINSGNTPKSGEQFYVDKGITFFRSRNVWKDRLEMDDIAYIDEAANVNGHVHFIRLRTGVNNKFVSRILVSDEYRDYIRSVCVGGIDKRQLNKDHLSILVHLYICLLSS